LAAIAAQQSALSFWRPAHHSESVAHAHEILQRLIYWCMQIGS
jgi:hypothetical protein